MSLSSSVSGISFGGIASGLDTESIITKLTQAETSSVKGLQQQQQALQTKAGLYDSLTTQINSLTQAFAALNSSNAFQSITANVADPTVVSVTTAAGTQAGSYSFKVSQLAQAEKMSSAAQTSTTTALNQTGQFEVNGAVVNVTATDTLQSLAGKINALNVGVSAGVIDGGSGQAYITFTSNQTGVSNKPLLADLTGNTLGSLGVLSSTTSVRSPITNGASSYAFNSTTSPVGTILGANGLASQTVQINGTNVSINLATDSLQNIADKINSAGTGANATVVASQNNGATTYQLQISGSSSTPSLTDSGNTLTALGILQNNPSKELVAAKDANYSIDNVNLTSPTNTITNVIAGATVTLLKADSTTPPTTTLTLTNDTGAVAASVSGIMTAYNAVTGFISQNSTFDATTYATGPLFGDSLVQQLQSTLSNSLTNNVPGLTGNYKNLVDIGFGLDTTGNMTVDNTKLTAALKADPASVQKIFQDYGTSSSGNLSFVSSTSSTLSSTNGAYDVNITQVPTKTKYVANTTKTGPSTTSETLTFAGSMFSLGSVSLTLDIGSNMSDIINKINNDPRLKGNLVASNNNGQLEIDSSKYGANGQFTLVSNQSPTGTNSGVGFSGTLTNGLDVAGTIAGQAATGVGQFLTGASTNTVANGLQIQFTGTSAGDAGTINFTSGLNGIVTKAWTAYTDITNGLDLTGAASLRSQSDTIQKNIDAINKSASDKATELRNQFAAMESAIANFQAQGNQLSALTSSGTTTASTTGHL